MNTFFSRTRAGRRARRLTVVGLTGTLVVAAGGVGYAAWSSSTNAGSSNAKSVSAQVLTVTGSTDGQADLYPGASGAVYFTVTNPNPYPVRFTDAAFTTVVSDDAGQCLPSVLSTTNQTGLQLDVAANATSAVLSIPGAVTMSTGAGDGCQGRTFTITTTLTGLSR